MRRARGAWSRSVPCAGCAPPQEAAAVDLPAPELQRHQASHPGRRDHQVARRPVQQHHLVDGPALVMAGGQPRADVALQPQGRALHPQRREHLLSQEAFVGKTAHLLDDGGGHGVARLRIGEPAARAPARHPRVGVVGQHLAQRAVLAAVGIEDLVEPHLVEPGGVLQQVRHPDRVGALPAVLHRQLGQQVAHAVFQPQPPRLHQAQNGQGDERLGHRTHPEQRLGRHATPLQAGQTEALHPDPGAVHHRHRRPRPPVRCWTRRSMRSRNCGRSPGVPPRAPRAPRRRPADPRPDVPRFAAVAAARRRGQSATPPLRLPTPASPEVATSVPPCFERR